MVATYEDFFRRRGKKVKRAKTREQGESILPELARWVDGGKQQAWTSLVKS